MHKWKFVVFSLAAGLLASCTSYQPCPNPARPYPHTKGPVSSAPIYSVDSHGKMKRDLGREQIINRGCQDNSTDCGRGAGW